MLLPTMTPEEIYAEMHKDAEWLENTINKKFVPQYQKGAKRATNYPYLKSFYEVSPKTLITYWVVMIAYHRSDWKKPRVAILAKYSHEYGTNIIYIENDRFAIRLYTPHFMQRIKERCSAMNYKVPIEMNHFEDMMLILCNRDVEELTMWKELEKEHKDNELYQELYMQKHIKQSFGKIRIMKDMVWHVIVAFVCAKEIRRTQISLFTILSSALIC